MEIKQIKFQIESSVSDFRDVVLQSNSYSDLCRYYNLPNNGKQHKYLKEIIKENNISTNHWNWHIRQRKYKVIKKLCPVCDKEFITKLNNKNEKTVCSRKCSNVYFSSKRHTKESNQKISNSIRKYHASIGKFTITKTEFLNRKSKTIPLLRIKCLMCGNEKLTKKKTQKFCSNKCSVEFRKNDPVYLSNLKSGIQKCIKEGRHKPWKSRNILSYPERFFIKVLNNNGIKFVSNKPFMGYFLDFAIENKMIDLEIDGKQHTYDDRKESDKKRDIILIENGWKVYRIPWNSINTISGKLLMKEKIEKFLKFYFD